MKQLLLILTLAASFISDQSARAAGTNDLTTVHASMTWTPVHSITNQVGEIRQASTAPASKEFWKAWRADKTTMRKAGYSARPTDNGWEAIHYVQEAKP